MKDQINFRMKLVTESYRKFQNSYRAVQASAADEKIVIVERVDFVEVIKFLDLKNSSHINDP